MDIIPWVNTKTNSSSPLRCKPMEMADVNGLKTDPNLEIFDAHCTSLISEIDDFLFKLSGRVRVGLFKIECFLQISETRQTQTKNTNAQCR